MFSIQTLRTDGTLFGVFQDDSSFRDGNESKGQRLPPRMFRLSAVQSQVVPCSSAVLNVAQELLKWTV